MIRKKLKIINKLGLHARATMQLVNTAARYQSEILIKYKNREVNAKSIMNLMVLAASQGSEIELIVKGEDEEDAAKAVIQLINNRFGEEE